MAKGQYKFKYIGDFEPISIQKWKISAGFQIH